MPSKYNLDVNVVNYLITHKSTIGADSAMNDISFPRQSWGEGGLLWKILWFALPLYSPTSLGEAAVSASQREDVFTKHFEEPIDSPAAPKEGPESMVSSSMHLCGKKSICTTGYRPCPTLRAWLTKAFLTRQFKGEVPKFSSFYYFFFPPCHRKKQEHQQHAFILWVILSDQQQLYVSWSHYFSPQSDHSQYVYPEWDTLVCQIFCLVWFLTTVPLSWLRKIFHAIGN